MKAASQKRMRRRWSVSGMYVNRVASRGLGRRLGHGTVSIGTARNCLVYGFGRNDREQIGSGLGWGYFPGARNARKPAFQQRSDTGQLPRADEEGPERP